MSRSPSRRSMRLASSIVAALLALGVYAAGSTSASAAPASAETRSAPPPTDMLSAGRLGLELDGRQVEFLQEISGVGEREATVVRGKTPSAAVDDWISDAQNSSPDAVRAAALVALDADNNVVRRIRLDEAFVSKVSNTDVSSGDATTQVTTLTITFTRMVIE